jgi:hypothetical protein
MSVLTAVCRRSEVKAPGTQGPFLAFRLGLGEILNYCLVAMQSKLQIPLSAKTDKIPYQ